MEDLKLKENEVVHCKTEKQAKKVLKIAKKLGVKNTEVFIEKWNDEKKNTCYRFSKGFFGVLYSSRVFYESSGDEIITSKEFLKRHKKSKADKVGDIVKAWDDDESKFVYGSYDGRVGLYFVVLGRYFLNIEKVTKISIDDFI